MKRVLPGSHREAGGDSNTAGSCDSQSGSELKLNVGWGGRRVNGGSGDNVCTLALDVMNSAGLYNVYFSADNSLPSGMKPNSRAGLVLLNLFNA